MADFKPSTTYHGKKSSYTAGSTRKFMGGSYYSVRKGEKIISQHSSLSNAKKAAERRAKNS